MSYQIILAKNLRKLRLRYGFTQLQLSGMINIDRTYYSRIENAKVPPTIDIVMSLAEIFHLSLDALLFQELDPSSLLDHINQMTGPYSPKSSSNDD